VVRRSFIAGPIPDSGSPSQAPTYSTPPPRGACRVPREATPTDIGVGDQGK